MDIYRSNGTLSKQHFSKTGLPYIQYGQIHTGKFLTQDDRYITYIDPQHCSDRTVRAQAGDLLLTGVSEDLEGLCRPLLWQGEEVILSQSIILLKFKSDQIDPLYLAYFFKSYDFYCQKYKDSIGVTIHNISADALRNIQVTVPPLHIQQAIGKFLHKIEEIYFSKEFGINTEIEYRKKQFYEYSHSLLSLYPTGSLCIADNPLQSVKELEEIPLHSVGELCTIKLGNPILDQNYLSSNHGPYPVYTGSINGAQGYIDTYDYDGEYVTYIYSSAGCGETYYRNEKFSINKACHVMQVKDKSLLDTRYLAYIFNIVCKKHINPANGMAKLNSSTTARIQIPVPPMHIQVQIADLLQAIENLITDKEGGLEKELQLRTKQFEAYLDKFF